MHLSVVCSHHTILDASIYVFVRTPIVLDASKNYMHDPITLDASILGRMHLNHLLDTSILIYYIPQY